MVEFQKGQRKVGWAEWAGREKCAEPCEPTVDRAMLMEPYGPSEGAEAYEPILMGQSKWADSHWLGQGEPR
jgi:hypothetical protein